jgi:hypothetical protein
MLSVLVSCGSLVFSGCQPDVAAPQTRKLSSVYDVARLASQQVSTQRGGSFSQQLSVEIPEFGGAFFDKAGVLNVYLTDLSVASGAEASIRRKLVGGRGAGSQIKFLQGQYRYAYLKSLIPRMSQVPEITAVGINEGKNRLWVGMASKAAVTNAHVFAAQKGIPLGPLFITVQRPFKVLSSTTLTSTVRPLVGGLQVQGSTGYGSAGGIVIFNNTPYLLISGHVADHTGLGATGSTISQGSSGVGYVSSNPAFTYAKCEYRYAYPARCRLADAALVALGSGISSDGLAKFAAPGSPSLNSGTLTFDDSSPTNVSSEGLTCSSGAGCDPGYDVIGVPVSKVGYATGWTGGDILSADADVFGQDGFWRIHSVVAKGAAREGDSGASVLNEDRTRLLGLVWGMDTAYSGVTPAYHDSVFAYSPLRAASVELTGDPYLLHSLPARLLGYEARYMNPYSCTPNPDAWNYYIVWGWPDGHGAYNVMSRQASGHTTYYCGSGYVNGDYATNSYWTACEAALGGWGCPDAFSVSGGSFAVLEEL